MRLGIFTDVHSNLEALEAVLEAYKREKIDRYIFLGDVLGYGANPNECCKLIREIADDALIGNHDLACCGMMDLKWFVDHAKDAIEWTSKNLESENREWLIKLPPIYTFDQIIFSHGSPIDPNEFEYVIDIKEAEKIFQFMDDKYYMLFVGHAHQSFIFIDDGTINIKILESIEEEFTLSKRNKYIINVGSVGQPRDGDWRASYTIFDTEKAEYIAKKIKYNIHLASSKIRSLGLPSILSNRLFLGR